MSGFRGFGDFAAWGDAWLDRWRAVHAHHHHHHHGRDPREAAGGRRGGPDGGRGPRGFPPGFGGGGGPGGFAFRSARKLSAADLQLVLLALLAEQPRHGYDLIKAIEERSKGFYAPSPGVIYPALTYLEEGGEARSEADGTRKVYQLTDAGRARLARQRAEADAMLAQLDEAARSMERVREAFSRDDEDDTAEPFAGMHGGPPDIRAAVRLLREAMKLGRRASPERWERIVAVLRRAAEEIHAVMNEDDQA
ncbi:MAG: PadR family transcriptional regulator [Myxococcota bacterium]